MEDHTTTAPELARRDAGSRWAHLPTRWRSPAALTRAATAGLWLLIGGTFVASMAALLRPMPAVTEQAQRTEPTVGAEGFAELYVAAWLGAGRGDEEALRRFYPDTPSLAELEPNARWAARTTTLAADHVAEGSWAVTVAAEVFVATDGGFEPAGLHYYRVGVARGAGGLVVTGLPAEVPPPAAPKPAETAVAPLERPRPGDPLTHAVERFAAALLAGKGDLDRYLAPGVTLVAVTPPPFKAVELVRVAVDPAGADAATVAVQAEVIGTDRAGRRQVLHYPLELARRAGRWEVRRLLPAVPLDAAAARPTTDLQGGP